MGYFEAYDPAQGVSVWLVTGAAGPADWQQNIDTMLRLDREGCTATVLIADADARPPDAAWRKRIAATACGLKARKAFALVTVSLPMRGALTALNWFRPFKVPTRAFATVDEATDFVAAHTGVRTDLSRLVDDVRAQATIDAVKKT